MDSSKRTRLEAAEVQDLKRRCTGLEDVHKRHLTKIEALEAKVDALNEKNKQLDEKNKELSIGTEGDEVTITALTVELGKERDRIKDLQADSRDLRSQLSANRSRSQTLQLDLDKVNHGVHIVILS